MSIKGQSFAGGTDGALVTFDVGNAANLFTGAFTIVCLAKFTASNWGMLGGYSDSVGGTVEGGMLLSNNSGGRLFSVDDFTSGFPAPGDLASPGLSDDTWRWLAASKPAGAAHYRYHYADLATLTWAHGETASAADHGDADPVVVFSTWLVYAMGFDSGDMAALAAFDSDLSTGGTTDAAIEAACTQLAQDLADASPAIGWLFPEATAGSAVEDFTGGGGDETGRQLIATSADPADFDFTIAGTDATINATTIAATAALPAPASITAVSNATVTPGRIAASAALPALTASGGATVAPGRIAATAALPAGTVSAAGNATVNATTIAASAALPVPTASGGATVAPARIAATAALPASAASGGATVTPGAVAAVATLPAAGARAGSTVTPGVVAAVAAVPAVSITAVGDATVSPATIAARAALPSPRVSSGVTASVRLGGQLVATTLRGVVRLDGAPVAFG